MAGSDAHYNARIEVGQHGFALFLNPDAEYPVLDVNGTSEQLDVVVRSKPPSRPGVPRTPDTERRRRGSRTVRLREPNRQ